MLWTENARTAAAAAAAAASTPSHGEIKQVEQACV